MSWKTVGVDVRDGRSVSKQAALSLKPTHTHTRIYSLAIFLGVPSIVGHYTSLYVIHEYNETTTEQIIFA